MESHGRRFGTGRGAVYPAAKATALLSPARRLVQSPARTVARAGLSGHERVLEVGCGPGYFSPTLAGVLSDGVLVALDLQVEMLKSALGRAQGAGRVVGVQADAAALPFATSSIDAVVAILMLGEVEERDACFGEIARVLRPSGQLIVGESRRDSDFLALRSLVGALERHGFTLVERHGIRWEYTARFRRKGAPWVRPTPRDRRRILDTHVTTML